MFEGKKIRVEGAHDDDVVDVSVQDVVDAIDPSGTLKDHEISLLERLLSIGSFNYVVDRDPSESESQEKKNV